MIRNVVSDVVHLNFASLRTVAGLFTRAGAVAREYVLDPDANLARPFSYAFWTSTLWVLANKFLDRASDVAQFFNPFLTVSWLWPYAGIALLVPIAALQRLMFRKREFTAAESFNFLLYTFGQIVLYEIGLLFLSHATEVDLGWIWLRIPEALYAAWAATGFYKSRSITTWLRGALLYVLGAGLMMGVMYLYQMWRLSGLFS